MNKFFFSFDEFKRSHAHSSLDLKHAKVAAKLDNLGPKTSEMYFRCQRDGLDLFQEEPLILLIWLSYQSFEEKKNLEFITIIMRHSKIKSGDRLFSKLPIKNKEEYYIGYQIRYLQKFFSDDQHKEMSDIINTLKRLLHGDDGIKRAEKGEKLQEATVHYLVNRLIGLPLYWVVNEFIKLNSELKKHVNDRELILAIMIISIGLGFRFYQSFQSLSADSVDSHPLSTFLHLQEKDFKEIVKRTLLFDFSTRWGLEDLAPIIVDKLLHNSDIGSYAIFAILCSNSVVAISDGISMKVGRSMRKKVRERNNSSIFRRNRLRTYSNVMQHFNSSKKVR